jgi:hypothetical protein
MTEQRDPMWLVFAAMYAGGEWDSAREKYSALNRPAMALYCRTRAVIVHDRIVTARIVAAETGIDL